MASVRFDVSMLGYGISSVFPSCCRGQKTSCISRVLVFVCLFICFVLSSSLAMIFYSSEFNEVELMHGRVGERQRV